MEPTPIRPQRNGRQFLLGLALGAIPLVIWMIFIGAAAAQVAQCRSEGSYCSLPGLNPLLSGLGVFAVLWVVQLIVTLVMLARGTRSFLAYGLLAMLVVGPIVGSIACINYQALPAVGAYFHARPIRGPEL